jgi:hypothetical protein
MKKENMKICAQHSAVQTFKLYPLSMWLNLENLNAFKFNHMDSGYSAGFGNFRAKPEADELEELIFYKRSKASLSLADS